MIPAKMTSEPQNYLQAPQYWSPSLSDVTKPPSTKNLFLKISQHNEIVQNDTLTFVLKSESITINQMMFFIHLIHYKVYLTALKILKLK